MISNIAAPDTLRSLAHGSISGSYAAVGTIITKPIRLICFTNNTDADMFFSLDGSNDNFFVAKTSFKLFDLGSNRDNTSIEFSFKGNTQVYVKQSSAPGSGDVYVEVIYAVG